MDRAALMRALCYVQANLDTDLSLQTLAKVAGCSPAYFSRCLPKFVGETAKAYISRLRLEQAALRLILLDESILRIALDCGYQSHETFTRAFRKQFQMSPTEFRTARRVKQLASNQSARVASEDLPFHLSKTEVRTLAPIWAAFVRHTGPYQQVPTGLWQQLIRWAHRKRIPGPYVLFGVAHDAPGITDERKLRFDACLRVASEFRTESKMGCQFFPGRAFAFTTFVGNALSIPPAYRTIVQRIKSDKTLVLQGGPTFEFYRTNEIAPDFLISHTEIGIPVFRDPSRLITNSKLKFKPLS